MLEDRLQRTELTEDEWSFGRPDAPVILLEYGDFECPHCAAARPVLEGLVADDPAAIRLVYRHFPVSNIHPHALTAAEAAEAAGAQGKFWEMHDMLFTHQQRLDDEAMRGYAGAIDLDLARFERDLERHVHLPEVREDFRRGVQDGVNGTPTIFINGLRYDGPRDRASMLAAIAALAEVGRSR